MRTFTCLVALLLTSVVSARTIVSGSNDFYVVSADLDRNGAYTVGTGAMHPVTIQEGQASAVLRGGSNFISGISFNSIRSYSSNTDYFMGLPNFISAVEPGYDCVVMRDEGLPTVEMISEGGRDIGFTLRWSVSHGSDDLLVEERLVARGEEFTNSAAEVTLTVTNNGPAPVELGLRYAWSLALGNTGGATAPTIGLKPPEPVIEPLPIDEFAIDEPSERSFIVSNEERPSDPGGVDSNAYVIEATVGGIPLDPPPTPPERLIYTHFGQDWMPIDSMTFGPLNACFGYDIADPPRPTFNANTSGVVYFWGATPGTAREVAPGESMSVTQYIFAYIDWPLSCDAGAAQVAECTGLDTSFDLDASDSENRVDADLEYLWTSDDPAVAIEDETSPSAVAHVAAPGVHEVSLLVHRGAFATSCTTGVEVDDSLPPDVSNVEATPNSLWPPNHRMVPVAVGLDVTDACDPGATIRLVDARSNEPFDVRRGGDGHTSDDIQGAEIGTADFEVLLRAERQGGRAGRTYTLVYEVTDASGNVTTVPVTVPVSHDQRPSRRR